MSNRRHDTESEREHWLAHFEKQRSTATSFCREHGLCYQTFLRWRQNARKTKSSTVTPAPFFELEIPARHHGADPQAYLRDLIDRLPSCGSDEASLRQLLSENWAAAQKQPTGHPAAGAAA